MSISNIEKVFRLVDNIDRKEGLKAYSRYHTTLRHIAETHGVGFVQVVAAFAALSPNNDYKGNLRSLKTLVVGYAQKTPVENLVVSTYNECKIRAWAYLTGERDFLMETKGPKTRAFYYNIVKPTDEKHITIDGHMANIYVGEVRNLKTAAKLGFPYAQIAKDYIWVAKRHSLIPNQLQAMLWFTWKRINNIVYSPQMSLLQPKDDVWGLKVKSGNIIPFEVLDGKD